MAKKDTSLTRVQVADIVARYDHGNGDSAEAIAAAMEIGVADIKFHLKREGVWVEPGEEPTDEQLGIGVDDEVEEEAKTADPLAELLKNADLKSYIDAAIEARVKEIVGTRVAAPTKTADFDAFLEKMERFLQAQAVQQPGYQKPVSTEELERRSAGHVEMWALLKTFRAEEVWPKYILGDIFYGPSPAGPMLYEEGMEIATLLPPAEHFKPINEPAARVYNAMMQSIGGETPPIAELIARAMIEAKEQTVIVAEAAPKFESDVHIVEGAKKHNVKPKRIAGTLVPETLSAGPRIPGANAPGTTAYVDN